VTESDPGDPTWGRRIAPLADEGDQPGGGVAQAGQTADGLVDLKLMVPAEE
jgi:hypothetical protein